MVMKALAHVAPKNPVVTMSEIHTSFEEMEVQCRIRLEIYGFNITYFLRCMEERKGHMTSTRAANQVALQ